MWKVVRMLIYTTHMRTNKKLPILNSLETVGFHTSKKPKNMQNAMLYVPTMNLLRNITYFLIDL